MGARASTFSQFLAAAGTASRSASPAPCLPSTSIISRGAPPWITAATSVGAPAKVTSQSVAAPRARRRGGRRGRRDIAGVAEAEADAGVEALGERSAKSASAATSSPTRGSSAGSDRATGCAPPSGRARRSSARPRAPIRLPHRPAPMPAAAASSCAPGRAPRARQPLRQHIGADPGKIGLQLRKAARSVSELAQHQHRPALAEQLHRVGEPAGIVVAPFFLDFAEP